MKNNRKLKCLVVILTVAMVALGAVSVTAFADQPAAKSDSGEKEIDKKVISEDETVYVLTNAGGKENQRIISEKGTLHYDGYENYQLPVTMKIRYTLDGKEIQPDKLAGRSGHVVMRITYKNHTYTNGACVPFLAVSGMVLDNSRFSDIQVDGGKKTDDGSRSVVLGFSLPGVSGCLGSAASKVDLPETVTVSADVTDFELDTIYTFVTSDVFAELDIDGHTDLSDLGNQMEKLTNGVDALVTGTKKLDDGALKLSAGAEKLMEGTEVLKTGAGKLYDGTQALKQGVGQLTKGTGELQKGADALYAGAGELKNGADQLSAGLSQLSKSSGAVNAGAKQIVDVVFASASQNLQAAGMNVSLTPDNYGQILDQAAAGGAAQASALKKQLDDVTAFYAGLQAYTSGVDTVAAGAKNFSAGIDLAADGAKQLSTGTEALAKGQEQLEKGISQVNAGAKTLFDGTKTLRSKEEELTDGIKQLAKGADALNKGVNQMSDKLMAQLGSLSAGQLTDALNGLRAMSAAAREYDAWGSGDHYQSVKFIFKTEDISPR
ncbi:hypothetical protein ACPW7J_12025 [Ihubacter sp. rT4E-8]|uniref:hypothetical protein n=1 Tax=Ihubacter sp. rT4E-8 TaxID=3242369 RepID=UPI003CEB6A96